MKGLSLFLVLCALTVTWLSIPIGREVEKAVTLEVAKNLQPVIAKKHFSPPPSPTATPVVTKEVSVANSTPTVVQGSPSPDGELLTDELLVDNQTHVFAIPAGWQLAPDQKTFVTITFKVSTVETANGFDDPAFIVSIDDQPVYQLAASESEGEWMTKTFVIADHSRSISTWSGDTGDDQQHTTVTIKEIKLSKAIPTADATVNKIKQFTITKDSDQLSTLEWLSPAVSDSTLGKALRYELKYSQTANFTDDAWQSLPEVVTVLPELSFYTVRAVSQPEERLIKNNPDYGYVLIRSADWQGNYGPISVAIPT